MAPGLLMFAIYVLIPIFESIAISFYDWDGLGEKVFIGLGNYVELMDDDTFYVALKNNVLWLLLYLLAIPAGLPSPSSSTRRLPASGSTSRCSSFPS